MIVNDKAFMKATDREVALAERLVLAITLIGVVSTFVMLDGPAHLHLPSEYFLTGLTAISFGTIVFSVLHGILVNARYEGGDMPVMN